MYAVIRTGGKQYRVQPGATIDVERLEGEPGSQVELTDVLFVEQDGRVTIGAPTVTGAKVIADVVAQDRHKKVVIGTYKAKVRTRRRKGHRQHFTRLAIREIVGG